MERPGVIELDEEGKAVRRLAASADVKPFLDDHRLLVYRARTPWLGSVRTSFVKKREPSSSSMMRIGIQSKKLTTTSFDEGGKAAARSTAKVENVIETTLAAVGALWPEIDSAFPMLVLVMREYCLVQDTSFNELEGLHELEMGSAVH